MDVGALVGHNLLILMPLLMAGAVVMILSISLVFKHINRIIYHIAHRHGVEWAVLWGVAVVLCAVCIWAVVQ